MFGTSLNATHPGLSLFYEENEIEEVEEVWVVCHMYGEYV